MILPILASLALGGLKPSGPAQGLQRYVNARFNYRVDLPSYMKADADPTNGDGRHYQGRGLGVSVYGTNLALTVDEQYKLDRDRAMEGAKLLSAKRDKTGWRLTFLNAQTKNRIEHQTWLKKDHTVSVECSFPNKDAAKYKTTVANILKSVRA